MTNKERYSQWAAAQEYVPLFMMPWWLDAVCAGAEWDALLAEDSEGNILGAMPYLLRKRAWFKYIIMPKQTPIGGIWVTPEVTADKWKTAEVCRQIKEQLDRMGLVYYYQQFLPGSLCVDALKALGCKTKEHMTYRLDDLSDLNKLIESFSKNKRRELQKSLSLHAERSMDIEDFYRFYTQCMSERKHKVHFSREFLLVLERKAKRLNQCEIISIHDADGHVHAAAFLVWDANYMYYLIPTYSPTYADSGAGALLVLEAVKRAREKHIRFEFAGSFSKASVKHYKQFNAAPTKFYSVEKSYRWWSFLISWFS